MTIATAPSTSTDSIDRLVVVPVDPASIAAGTVADSLTGRHTASRRTFGFRGKPSRRTFGRRAIPSRRTFGRRVAPSRRTFGRWSPSRRTFGRMSG